MKFSNNKGALTIGVCCTNNSPMQQYSDIMITPIVGPEAVMGSTRMKAGTAQKLVLNMISTGVMIKLGKIYSNLMVDVQATNEKLVERAKRIVRIASGASDIEVEKILNETDYDVKLAIMMLLTQSDKDTARQLLKDNDGHIRQALNRTIKDKA